MQQNISLLNVAYVLFSGAEDRVEGRLNLLFHVNGSL